jgi:predicted amidohydrolase
MKDLHVILLQTAPVWNDPDASIAMVEDLLERADADGLLDSIDLIALPEMWTTGFTLEPLRSRESPTDAPGYVAMARWANRWNCAVAGSLAVQTAEHQFANRMHFVEPGGRCSTYDKRHLFGLGGETQVYRPGCDRVEVTWRGWRILLLICYDLRFPIFSRNLGSPPYDVALYSACWPAPRIAAWDILLAARAIENQCYVVGVNRFGEEPGPLLYPGHSRALSPLGEVLASAPDHQPQALHCVLSASSLTDLRVRLPFLQDGDRAMY